jgi:hypothetical protein
MDDFNSFMQNYNGPMLNMGANVTASPQAQGIPATQPAPKGPSGIGGFLARNAQNIGGGVGGAIGGILGLPANIADAFTGVGGTAIDAGMAAGGAGIGGGIGQDIKNFLDPSQKSSALKEGAIQGVSDIAGQGALKAAGKGLQAAGKGLGNIGEHYLASQAKGLTGDLANKAVDTFQGMKRYGVTSINGFKDFANKVTGEDGVLNTTKKDILGRAPSTVDVSQPTIAPAVTNIIRTTPGVTSGERKTASALWDSVNEQLGKLQGRGNLAKQNAADVFQTAQKAFEKSAAAMAKKTTPTPASQAASQMYGDIARIYQKQIDNVVGDQAVTDEDKQAMHDGLNKLGVTNKNLHSDVDNVKSYSDLRKIESTAVNASKIADQTQASASKGLLSKLGNANGIADIAGLGGALAFHNPLIAAPLLATTKPAKAIGGPALQKAGDISSLIGKPLTNAADTMANPAAKSLVPSAALHTGAVSTPGAINRAVSGPQVTVPNHANLEHPTGPVSSTVYNSINSQMEPYVQQVNAMQSGGGNTLADSVNNISPADYQTLEQQVGTRGIQNMMQLAEQTQPKMTQEQQNEWSEEQNSIQGLQQLANLWEGATGTNPETGTKGGSNTLIGKAESMPGLRSLIDPLSKLSDSKSAGSLQAYNGKMYEVASNVMKVVQGGGRTGGNSAILQIEKELPTIGESPETAQIKFQNIAQQIIAAVQNTLASPATNTPGLITNMLGASAPVGTSAATADLTGTAQTNLMDQFNLNSPASMQGEYASIGQ